MLLRVGAAVALFVAATAAAQAHAFLERAEPRVGSTIATSPKEVRLRFSEALDPSNSRVSVIDEQGSAVDGGDGRVGPADPRVLHATLKPLRPGTYKVIWRAVSTDKHATEGSHVFHVAP